MKILRIVVLWTGEMGIEIKISLVQKGHLMNLIHLNQMTFKMTIHKIFQVIRKEKIKKAKENKKI